jgi:4-diphosphocytidyl-2-C-methyl-D-erythritol kinase
MKSVQALSPAKINLTLEILGKRADGFHDLETLMCPVALFDDLEFECAEKGIELRVEGADLPADSSNLVWRAARLVQEASGCSQGVRILLKKRIPMGGGLAGGSGNAAVTLQQVNALWGCGLPVEELKKLAGKLGSDIAFFLDGGASWCTGRGEVTRPVGLDLSAHVLLINPGFGVPTPWAYQAYAANPLPGEAGRLEVGVCGLPGRNALRLRNDLEPAVFAKYKWIEEGKAWCLRQPGVMDAMMSGSGATVFALLPDEEAAGVVAGRARDYFGPNCWIQTTRLLP